MGWKSFLFLCYSDTHEPVILIQHVILKERKQRLKDLPLDEEILREGHALYLG